MMADDALAQKAVSQSAGQLLMRPAQVDVQAAERHRTAPPTTWLLASESCRKAPPYNRW